MKYNLNLSIKSWGYPQKLSFSAVLFCSTAATVIAAFGHVGQRFHDLHRLSIFNAVNPEMERQLAFREFHRREGYVSEVFIKIHAEELHRKCIFNAPVIEIQLKGGEEVTDTVYELYRSIPEGSIFMSVYDPIG